MLFSTSPLKEQFNGEGILYRRLRIPAAQAYKDPDTACALSRYASRLSGVKEARANPVTGTLLVIFNEETVSEMEILRHVHAFSVQGNESLCEGLEKSEGSVKASDSNKGGGSRRINSYQLEEKGESWHSMKGEKVKELLETDYNRGLSGTQVSERINELGLNTLSEKKRSSLFSKFLKHLKEFPANLLLGVGTVSLLLGQLPEAIALFGVVLVETVIGSVQQHKAERSMHSLKDVLLPSTKVLREGTVTNVEAQYLVPGDIVLLEAGDKVPADLRLLEGNNLRVTEASLTGEAAAVSKTPELCSKITELGNRRNMLYMGSDIISGNCRAVVTATGSRTQIGRISEMLEDISAEQTPMQQKIKKLTDRICRISLIGFLAVGSIALLLGASFPAVITTGASIVVGALPEGLPAVVAVSLALSARRITKEKAVIRKLTAVETLGSASVICCDKTGTLTLNEMTVKEIVTTEGKYLLKGEGYNPEGGITAEYGSAEDSEVLHKLLLAGALCNNSSLVSSDKGWIVNGDPTEGALLAAAGKAGISTDGISRKFERIKEIPFDSSRRYMTVVVKDSSSYTAYCKGATDCLLEKCKFIYHRGEERLLTAEEKKRLLDISESMGERALRVLAMAYKSTKTLKGNLEKNYVFLGFAGMEDPPRKDVREAVSKCHKAGIKVVMITGDHKSTASSIGRVTGILTEGLVVTGAELDAMSDAELEKVIDSIQVFARTSPEQKYRIVKALKKQGHVVAMTGDGVNDAPAIKEANIGIAMGAKGSDLAKDVAAVTLIDDNFNTIVKAIEEGRIANQNIKNSMKYLLIGNIAEILTVALSSFFIGSLPLISVQILWFNIVSESILGSAAAVERSGKNIMKEPPAKIDEPILGRKMIAEVLKRGGGTAVSTSGLFGFSMLLGQGLSRARSLAFANIICSQIVNLFSCRNNREKKPSRYMLGAAAASFILLIAALYVPFLNSFLGTLPLGAADWSLIGVLNMGMALML
jgi:P-type Ca2+ transporter type 2C